MVRDHPAAVTEPDKGQRDPRVPALAVLACHEHTPSRVVMATRSHPLTGYPFTLDVAVAYELDEDGLIEATTATNAGSTPCPYGSGQHPYVSPGTGTIDACTVELDARTRIKTDEERQLPIGTEPVVGTPFDFSRAPTLGDLEIDYAFTDLARDHSGRAWVRLSGADGARAALWVDEHYPILELYTGDTRAPDRRRRGLGAEPMTCPPNAFQTGDVVVRLAPGQSLTTRWGVQLT